MWSRAERACRRIYGIFDEMGMEGYVLSAAAALAQVLCVLDRFDEAAHYAAIARSAAARMMWGRRRTDDRCRRWCSLLVESLPRPSSCQ